MSPLRICVREAKINLTRLLTLVQQDREIVLTLRGRPVGRLVSMDSESLSLDERIKRFEDMGLPERRSPGARRRLPAPIPARGGCAQRINSRSWCS